MSMETPNSTPSPLSERFKFVSGTPIREPNLGREDVYRPWEAPGLADRQSNPVVRAHQEDVDRMIRAIIKKGLPKKTPATTRDFVEGQFLGKDLLLDSANKAGYEARTMLLPSLELSEELRELHNRVMIGTATPEEIDMHMLAVGASSAELALLRTAGGLRAEHEQPMLDDVSKIMGDNVKVSGPQKLEIVEYGPSFYAGGPMDEMMIRFKREIDGDRQDDVTAKTRNRLIIKTSEESGFDQNIRHAIELAARHAIEHGLPKNHPLNLRRPRQIVTEIAETGSAHPHVAASVISAYEVDPNHTANLRAAGS